MKKIFVTVLAMVAIAATVIYASESIIEYFTAESDGQNITIKWKSKNEDGLDKYVIERSADNSYFKAIHDVDCKGHPNYYNFVDEEAFMKDITYGEKNKNDELQSENEYKYRIKIVKSNKSFLYTDAINVAHNPSSIRRTWGMIKEMFK